MKTSTQRQVVTGESNQKCIFDSDRRFELRRIRVIRVRDIEIRLYIKLSVWNASTSQETLAF